MENNLQQVLQECNQTCKNLSTLLENENKQLEARNVKAVEANLKEKRQLTNKLEKFIFVIKNNIEKIQSKQESLKELKVFKNLIGAYQKLLEKNARLLRAAYTATTTILSSIQKKTARPAVKTYNAYGQVQESVEPASSLVNYSV